MFHVRKKKFNKSWPVIAVPIEGGKPGGPAPGDAAARPSPSIAAEAGYVLGIALGYALSPAAPASTAVQARAAIRYWPAEICDG
jgi:hypothetical protein